MNIFAIIALVWLCLLAIMGFVLMLDWWRSTRFDPVREAKKILEAAACEQRQHDLNNE
jgi:hypothetical protein